MSRPILIATAFLASAFLMEPPSVPGASLRSSPNVPASLNAAVVVDLQGMSPGVYAVRLLAVIGGTAQYLTEPVELRIGPSGQVTARFSAGFPPGDHRLFITYEHPGSTQSKLPLGTVHAK